MTSISESDEVPQFTEPKARYLTPEEGRALFERQAQRRLGMSGAEFIRAYQAGELVDHPQHSDVESLWMLRYFAFDWERQCWPADLRESLRQ